MSTADGPASSSALPRKLNAALNKEVIMSEFIIHGHAASPFLRSVCLGLEEKDAPYRVQAGDEPRIPFPFAGAVVWISLRACSKPPICLT